MELKVDEKTMGDMVAKAMFETFTPEKREEMVMNAIKGLLEVPNSQYDKTPAIQRLFREQAEYAARKIALQRLENDETFKAGIEAIFSDAAKKCFEDGEARAKIVGGLAEGIRKAVTGDRY